MHARVPSAAPRAAAVFLAGAVVVLVVCTSCGGRPGSPEELYAKVAELNGAGETGKIWDLLTDDAKERWIKVVDDERTFLKRNPDPTNLKGLKQFKCTREQFDTLPYTEIYSRENLGNERAFVDAKIVDKAPDPRAPADVILTVQSPLGTKFFLRTRPANGGWGLVEIVTVAQ
jgi:hypothetical protein